MDTTCHDGGRHYMMSDSFRTEMISTDVMTSGDRQRIRNHFAWLWHGDQQISGSADDGAGRLKSGPRVVQLANGVVYGKLAWGRFPNITARWPVAMAFSGLPSRFGKGIVERSSSAGSARTYLEGWLDRWGGKAFFAIRAIPWHALGISSLRHRG